MLILNCFQQWSRSKKKKDLLIFLLSFTGFQKHGIFIFYIPVWLDSRIPHIKIVLFLYIWRTFKKRKTTIPRWFKRWPFYPRSLRVTEPLKGSRELTIWEKRSRKRRIARPKVLSGSRKIDHNIHKKKYWSSWIYLWCGFLSHSQDACSSPPGWRPKHFLACGFQLLNLSFPTVASLVEVHPPRSTFFTQKNTHQLQSKSMEKKTPKPRLEVTELHA